MVFCCIAIVAIAILYFFGLWLRQLFSFPRRDKSVSQLPRPPRALSGNGALPVYGHTRLFTRMAGDVALLFNPDWREIQCLPKSWSRRLGDCFAIFIWGQWRVVVKGPERARLVMDSQDLKEGWPWKPPKLLLGGSCFSFLEDDEAEQLRQLLTKPLSQRTVVQYAPLFAEAAGKCLDDIVSGKFKRFKGKRVKDRYRDESSDRDIESGYGTDMDDDTFCMGPGGEQFFKVKWEALRSYTFDLIDGPVLSMNKWVEKTEQQQGESTSQDNERDESQPDAESKRKLPKRETMLLWMERMKVGVDVIKMTFGPEWMYVWLLNEYGRALNARMHIEKILHKHVEAMTETVPVSHLRGHSYHDPTTQPVPLLTLRDNLLRNKEGIFGENPRKVSLENRARSLSTPARDNMFPESDEDMYDSGGEYADPYLTEQDLARPRYEKSPVLRAKKVIQPPPHFESPTRKSFRDEIDRPKAPRSSKKKQKKNTISILERLLRQQDTSGSGLSQVVTTELSILLWLMMDVGNAWTAMALNLLATDKDARHLVQEELDVLEMEFGHEELFSPSILAKMSYMDALLYEAIRLCPANLGGMKMTTATVELEDAGVQIAKGTHIIFCQPTDMKFDIAAALGKKPQDLGKLYPNVEL